LNLNSLSVMIFTVMSTHIILDGYNVIRQSGPLLELEAISLEEGRAGLIKLLSDYKKIRGYTVTVVFDGWQSDNAFGSSDKVSGINVIYTGRGEKADDLIKKMAEKMKTQALVVTSDRDIATFAIKHGAVVIPSPEFENKIRMVTDETFDYEFCRDDEPERLTGTKKKGPARRVSKIERKKRNRLNKL